MLITLDWTGNVGFKARTRQFDDIIVDEPAEFHGDDRGPSAVEYLGIGIAGCLGTSMAYCLQRMEVPVKAMRVSIDVDMHHVDDEPGNPLRITGADATINVILEDDADRDMLDLCIESFKKYCVVTQSVMKGIPVTVNVQQGETGLPGPPARE